MPDHTTDPAEKWAIEALIPPHFDPKRDRILYIPTKVDFKGPGSIPFSDLDLPEGALIRPRADAISAMTWPSPELDAALRALPPRGPVWMQAMAEIRSMVVVATDGLKGALHIFIKAPHALGAYLGACLESGAQGTKTLIYNQFGDGWQPYGSLKSLGSQVKEPLNWLIPPPLDEDYFVGASEGMIIIVDFPRRTSSAALGEARRQLRISSTFRIKKSSTWDGYFRSLEQAQAVIGEAAYLIEKIRDKGPKVPIHILTSAPLPVLIAIGQMTRPAVSAGVVIHHYQPKPKPPQTGLGDVYHPIIDIHAGALANSPSHLRIHQGVEGKGYFFELNGQTIPLVRDLALAKHLDLPPPGPPLDEMCMRRGFIQEDEPKADGPLNALREWGEARSVWTCPAAVEDALIKAHLNEGGTQVDVEVELDTVHGELSWEFLYLKSRGIFAATQPGWSIGRHVKSAPPYTPPSPLPERIKVLVFCALDPQEDHFDMLDPDGLCDQLSALGLDVYKELCWDFNEMKRTIEAVRPHVVHWIGHGRRDAEEGLRGIFYLRKGESETSLTRDRFQALFQPLRAEMPRLLILTACELGSASTQGYGLPEAVLDEGFGAVIAFRDKVAVGAALTFTKGFYPPLAKGASIRESLQNARTYMHLAWKEDWRSNELWDQLSPSDFGAPVLLYGDRNALGPMVAPRGRATHLTQPPQEDTHMSDSNTKNPKTHTQRGDGIKGRGDLDPTTPVKPTITKVTPGKTTAEPGQQGSDTSDTENPTPTEGKGSTQESTSGARRADGKGRTSFR